MARKSIFFRLFLIFAALCKTYLLTKSCILCSIGYFIPFLELTHPFCRFIFRPQNFHFYSNESEAGAEFSVFQSIILLTAFEMCGNFHGDFQWSIGGDLQLQFLRLLCLMTSLAVRVTFSDSNLDSTTGKTFDAAAKQALILWKTTSIHLYNSYTWSVNQLTWQSKKIRPNL